MNYTSTYVFNFLNALVVFVLIKLVQLFFLKIAQNSCPLCQEQNVAEEVRCFETDEDFTGSNNNNDNSDSLTRFALWRRRAYTKFLDIVTGRNHHLNRMPSFHP